MLTRRHFIASTAALFSPSITGPLVASTWPSEAQKAEWDAQVTPANYDPATSNPWGLHPRFLPTRVIANDGLRPGDIHVDAVARYLYPSLFTEYALSVGSGAGRGWFRPLLRIWDGVEGWQRGHSGGRRVIFSGSRVAVAPCAQGVQAPMGVVGFRAGAAPGRYGSAHCRAMSRGQSTAQNGAAAEESVRVMRLAETTSRAPARRTLSRRRRRLHPVPVAFSMARRAMCMA